MKLARFCSQVLIATVFAEAGSLPGLAQTTSPPPPSGAPARQTEDQGFSSSLVTTDEAPTPPAASSSANLGAITILENTVLRVRTDQPMSSRQTKEGTSLLFTVSEEVVVDGVLVIPRGATVHGTVVESIQPGTLTGSPELTLKLTSLDLGGYSYPLYTYLFKVQGTSKTKPTEAKIKGGAVIGAIVGGAFSGSAKGETTATGKAAGMATGAALGVGVGTMVSAATPGPILSIPAESQMDFSLASPIAVVPVSAKEAARLAQGLHHGGSVLYVRDATP